MLGGVIGLLMFSHTYDADVERFRNGELDMKKGEAVITFKVESKLRMKDLQVLAEVALDMGFINTAVKYVNSAATEEKVENGAKKTVLALKKKVLTMHNGLLTKRKTSLTDEQITNPYFLDEQLGKWSKQPKFVKDLRHQDYDVSLVTKHGGDIFGMVQDDGWVQRIQYLEDKPLCRNYK